MAVKSSQSTTQTLTTGHPSHPTLPPPASNVPAVSSSTKKKKKKAAKKAAQAAAAASTQQPLHPNAHLQIYPDGRLSPPGVDHLDEYSDEEYDHHHHHPEDYEDEDEFAPLDPHHPGSAGFPYPPATGFTKTANGAIAAMGAAFGGMMSGLDYPASGLSPSAHADLVNTATELYRRMEDPSFGETEEYWTSLPSHLRNFIRNALPISPSSTGTFPPFARPNASPPTNSLSVAANSNNTGTVSGGSGLPGQPSTTFAGESRTNTNNAMLAMAQQIVSAAHANARNNGSNQVAFDSTSLDFALQPQLDHALMMEGRARAGAGVGMGIPNYAVEGVMMLNDRGPDDYDDEVDEFEEDVCTDEDDEDEHYCQPPQPNGETVSTKKKNKKKKKKAGANSNNNGELGQSLPGPPTSALPPTPQSAPVPIHPSLVRGQAQGRPLHLQQPATLPQSNSPLPPTSLINPQQNSHPHSHPQHPHPHAQPLPHPLPSARAKGKKPMAYSPVSTHQSTGLNGTGSPAFSTPLSATNPGAAAVTASGNSPMIAPARSAKAAGKAPSNGPPSNQMHPHVHSPSTIGQQHHFQPQFDTHSAYSHAYSVPTGPIGSTGGPALNGSGGKGGSAGKANSIGGGQGGGQSKSLPPAKIWNTNTNEERERIKDFWLALGEDERRGLVKVEKEAVLRKMKEQQKHSCGCAVCGRKRTAIEEELEVLYDAYYDELEHYANYQQQYAASGGTLPPPAGPGPFPGSVELDRDGALIRPDHLAPTSKPHHQQQQQQQHHLHQQQQHQLQLQQQQQQQLQQHHHQRKEEYEHHHDDDDDEEDEEEDEYSDEGVNDDEEDEDDVDEENEDDGRPHKLNRQASSNQTQQIPLHEQADSGDFFRFGGPLTTVKGGILTVADDLLKNDGQKFLEMMEQLAERRLQREEEAALSVEEDDSDLDEDDEDEDEDEEGDDDEDEDEDEEDDDEPLSDEQKMEEGRRMFQIFAARMFEQRVLQAYREKVAQERQLQLLRELEDEEGAAKAKEEKKAMENQKKKEKRRLQKLAKDEEKARKEAALKAEAEALKAKQAAHEREVAKRREDERARREAERKAKAEEAAKKEEEKKKRQAEEREREFEQQRKKKEKEEKARLEREAREKERKEKEEKERAEAAKKAAEERARKAREEEARKEVLRKEKEEREAKEEAEKMLALKNQEAQRAANAAKTAQLKAQKASAAPTAAITGIATSTTLVPPPSSSSRQTVPSPRKGPSAKPPPVSTTRQGSTPGPSRASPAPQLASQQLPQQVLSPQLQPSSQQQQQPQQQQQSSMALPPSMIPPPVQFSRQMPIHLQQQQTTYGGVPFSLPPQQQQSAQLNGRSINGSFSGVYGIPGYPGYPQSTGSPMQHRPSGVTASRPSPPPSSMASGGGAGSGGAGSAGSASLTGMFSAQTLLPSSLNSDPFAIPPDPIGGRRPSVPHTPIGVALGSHDHVASPGPSPGLLRGSVSSPMPSLHDFRAIQRPTPISRPNFVNGDPLDSVDESGPSHSGSTSRRSPSPEEGIFGSSALSPDDEIVPRRPSNVAAVWGAPGSSLTSPLGPSPWGSAGGQQAGSANSFASPSSASASPGIWSSSIGAVRAGSVGNGAGLSGWGAVPAGGSPFGTVGGARQGTSFAYGSSSADMKGLNSAGGGGSHNPFSHSSSIGAGPGIGPMGRVVNGFPPFSPPPQPSR